MAYWMLRSEPDAYSWDALVAEGGTEWTGVRNYTARNFLKAMAPGDEALFYHSNTERRAVGIMRVTRAWRPEGEDGTWASVAVEPVRPLAKAVTLAEIKATPALAGMMMLRQSRLSVSRIEPDEWATLMAMARE